MPGKSDAGERLRRLLALIPWLAERDGASLKEIADRFELTPERMRRELELAACCGLPPYSPDALIELVIEEDTVSARIPHYFSRPLRLTAADGLALLATGRALLNLPGVDQAGPLASALDKLAAVLGAVEGVTVDLDAPPHLAAVQDATERSERVEVDYYSAWRDELTTRRIDPMAVWSADGRWYVLADDHLTGEERRFRVDRIRRLQPIGESFRRRPVDPPDQAFAPGASAEIVTLRLPAEARWVVESYPTRSVEEDADGSLRVALAVLGRPWLERLLLRLGPEAVVLDPPEMSDVGQDAARRLLARYRR